MSNANSNEITPVRAKILNPATNRWIYADGCKGALLSAGIIKPKSKPRPQTIQEPPSTPRERPIQTPRESKKPQPVPTQPKAIVEKKLLKPKTPIKTIPPTIHKLKILTPRHSFLAVRQKPEIAIRSTRILEPKIRKTMASFFVKTTKK